MLRSWLLGPLRPLFPVHDWPCSSHGAAAPRRQGTSWPTSAEPAVSLIWRRIRPPYLGAATRPERSQRCRASHELDAGRLGAGSPPGLDQHTSGTATSDLTGLTLRTSRAQRPELTVISAPAPSQPAVSAPLRALW